MSKNMSARANRSSLNRNLCSCLTAAKLALPIAGLAALCLCAPAGATTRVAGLATGSATGQATAQAVIEMQSLSFEPKMIQVLVGQKVHWKNVSYTQHSATEDDKAGGFDTGLVDPKKESKAVVFSQPGTYTYHCSVHGKTMSGTIVVKGN